MPWALTQKGSRSPEQKRSLDTEKEKIAEIWREDRLICI